MSALVNSDGSTSPKTSFTAVNRPSPAVSSPVPHTELSEDSLQPSDDDEPQNTSYTYRRDEEPPLNEKGEMSCKYQQCNGISFYWKCDWNKHMDKHNRPYKCGAKGCEKLQGFTYSGGLLRHEREVHKIHGCIKKFFCRFPDCKRSSGDGFKRKENRDEHIRRVHRKKCVGNLGDKVISPKRKRDVPDEMGSEMKQLLEENKEHNTRLNDLERQVKALQQQAER